LRIRAKLALAVTDFFLVVAGLVAALGLRVDFDFTYMSPYMERQPWFFVSFGLFVVAMLWLFGLYEKVWRYAGVHELIGVVSAVTVAVIPAEIVVLVGRGEIFPRTGMLVAWLVCIFFCGGVRLLLRMASERLGRPYGSTLRVLIAGANDGGETVLRELSRGKRPYLVVGFVDDDPSRSRLRIRGVPVMGRLDDVPRLINDQEIQEVILAQLNAAQARKVVELTQGLPVQLRTLPAMEDMVEGRFQISKLKELSIEDLLERDAVRHDPERIASLLAGRRVLVTGAGGSIGAEICRQVVRFGPESLIMVGRGENSLYEIGLELAGSRPVLAVCDVRSAVGMRAVFTQHRPEIVFHAAAHKHVPMMEGNPAEAVANNVFGTLNVMELCEEFQTQKFILLSTDKAVNPTSMMGSSKRLAELLLARRGSPGFAAVRFGNVLGSRGSVVPTFRKQIASGGPVTITDPEMTRFFMTVPEAVTLVLLAATLARSGEIYILEMGRPVKILDLARNLIRLSGFEPDVDIPIQIIGARPGEKTEEELVNQGERAEPSGTEKVMRVVSAPPGAAWPGPDLELLRAAAERRDDETCRALVSRLIATQAEPALTPQP